MEYSGYSKINLSLDVVGRRDNGYHDLRMVMQTLQLRDLVDIEVEDSDETVINMTTSKEGLSCGEDNLCVKAAKLILSKCNKTARVTMHLVKNIPVAAGLAGGSADASAVLIGLNDMMKLGLSKKELMDMSVSLGADIPYCIMRGTALAEGIGEKLTPLTSMENYPIVIAKPPESVSTAYVYKNLDLDYIRHPDIDAQVEAINNRDIIGVTTYMGNVLESVTISQCPKINDIKRTMMANKALNSMMSGSGSAVFGIFPNEHQASKVLSVLKKSGLCETVLITYVYNGD